jgi:ATP/maltotriose-dependent transcriptional regulator MalT
LWHYEKSGYRMPLACLYCRTGQALLGLGDEKRAKAYLFDSLREAADMGAWQMFLESLLGIAQLSDVPSELAIELLVMIEAHPASNRYSRSRAKHLLAAMEAALIADDFAAAMKRGQTLNLPAAAALVEPFRIAPEIVRTTPNHLLSDPLSARELEVLALIAEGLTNQQIADQLYVGISTVKKHINHIYSKLDVTHRAQAVAQARTLKILQ